MPMKSATALLAATLFGLSAAIPTPAAALDIRFEAYTPPRGGDVILPMAGESLTGPAADVDTATGGALRRAIAAAGFTGAEGATLTLYGLGDFSRITLIGVGSGPVDAQDLRDLGARAAVAAGQAKGTVPALAIHALPGAPADAAVQAAFGAALGDYSFKRHVSGTDGQTGAAALVVQAAAAQEAGRAFAADWAPVAEGVELARDLANEPANVIYPASFVERVRAAFAGVPGVAIRVYDEPAMEARGMGALLGVGQGSARDSRLLVIEYRGAPDSVAPVVFAGKGVTFDTGGISLKEANGMWRMKYDMSGAGAVVGGLLAVAKRGAKANVVGIAALVENMPDGNAIRPGDILTSMSGKTVEVLNTDAEGRLILADAVWYAQTTYTPALLVDIATLTGAVRTALGDEYAGLFVRDDAIGDRLLNAGRAAGEEVWRLPLHPSYATDIRSEVADVKNVVEGAGLAGAGIGAQFIATFVKPETPWAHLDIASTGWSDGLGPTAPPRGLATGWGVRLFDQLIRDGFETR